MLRVINELNLFLPQVFDNFDSADHLSQTLADIRNFTSTAAMPDIESAQF